jgi:hypothetical protein
VLCGSFLFAASVRADCPWVLWVEAPVGTDQWSVAQVPEARFGLKPDCERQAQALNAFEALVASGERHSGPARDQFSCLPCTVDPRPESALLHEGPMNVRPSSR